MSSVRIQAPAKLNLGLAVLGKRDDGYHEVDTIMAMINLRDEITLTPRANADINIVGMEHVPVESNLMWKAVQLWNDFVGIEAGCDIEIDKRIPSPAGLGGGSSDAAAVLIALNELHDRPLTDQQLHRIAATIGADCPFFLNGPSSRATGIGTELRSVSNPEGWVVLAIPQTNVAAKTGRLYGELTAEDYGKASDIDVVQQHLASGYIGSSPLPNSFTAPALKLFPGLAEMREMMIHITGNAALSGAGPAMYAIAASASEAEDWVGKLKLKVPESVTVLTARFLQSRPSAVVSR